MTLPEILQPDSPFRPWALAMGACLIACLPRTTRRLGGTMLFLVAGIAAIAFFINSAYESFTPGG